MLNKQRKETKEAKFIHINTSRLCGGYNNTLLCGWMDACICNCIFKKRKKTTF
jgi:hypothetical protein